MNDALHLFHERFDNNETNHDFELVECGNFFIGKDSDNNVTLVIISNRPNRKPLRQKTKMLSVECNSAVSYMVDGTAHNDIVHIIRCFGKTSKEIDIFLELSSLFESISYADDQETAILETVSILSSFFDDCREPSYTEMEGLFGELYSILKFNETLDFSRYWQSEDRMKFDFSFTETLKVEVKVTLKSERKHHFRHEQLLGNNFKIYVISYMLRKDDEGLSLYDLICNTKPLLADYPSKILIIDKYLKNASVELLSSIRFNEELLKQNCRYFRASDIPRFAEMTPTGVSNAEYDCLLDSANSISEIDFIDEIKTNQNK